MTVTDRREAPPGAEPRGLAPPPRTGVWRHRAALGAAALLVIVLTVWSARGVRFSLRTIVDNWDNGNRALDEMLHPTWHVFRRTLTPWRETATMAILSTAVGCAIGLVAGFVVSRVTTPNTAAYLATKGVLNVLRALPDLLYALVFLAAIGRGPLPGVLALVVFDLCITSKLLSESVDAVDQGPLDAAKAAGAGRFQAVRAAVFPQVLPNFVAYTLYVLELNLRAAAVIGIVGAGGIGEMIDDARGFFRFGEISLIVIEIFVVVFLIELASSALRRRLV